MGQCLSLLTGRKLLPVVDPQPLPEHVVIVDVGKGIFHAAPSLTPAVTGYIPSPQSSSSFSFLPSSTPPAPALSSTLVITSLPAHLQQQGNIAFIVSGGE